MTDHGTKDHPTLAVVVTAYNYGHFLTACMNSVLSQTRLPDEIIVVDDGSSDGTPEVLKPYADRARVLRDENGGQAAGFNRGFAASEGDLVLFLDADDVLHPQAVETILLHWSSDLSHLVYELEMIDAGGASLGLHPGLTRPPAADNRPAILRRGSFSFPPTSGNVFSRRLLQAALPMPEERWRISADCFLVRAAGLYGRTGHLPQVLGGYRMHFANGYARLGPGGWEEGLHLSNQIDVADALDDLAAAPSALLGEDETQLRSALRQRADLIRMHGDDHVAQSFDGFAPLLCSRFLPILRIDRRYVLQQDLHVASGYLPGLRSTELHLRLPPVTGPLSIDLEMHAVFPGNVDIAIDGTPAGTLRPGRRHLSLSLAKAPFAIDRVVRLTATTETDVTPEITAVTVSAGQAARRAPVVPPPPGQAAQRVLARGLEPGAWETDGSGALILARGRGELTLSATRTGFGVLTLGLSGDPAHGWLSVSSDETRLFRGRTGAAGRIDMALPVPAAREVTLTLDFEPDATETAAFQIDSVALSMQSSAHPETAADPVIPVSVGEQVIFTAAPFAPLILGDGWSFDGSTAPRMNKMEAGLRFAVPHGAKDMQLSLRLSPLLAFADGPTAVVGISRDGEMVGSGQLLTESDFTVPIGPAPADGILDLTVHAVLDDAEEPTLAPMELQYMQLLGTVPPTTRPRAPAPLPTPGFQDLMDRALVLLADRDLDARSRAESLGTMRAAICAEIARSDVSLTLLFCGSERRLSELVDLAEAARALPLRSDEMAALAQLSGVDDERARATHALLGVLLLPAYRHPFRGDLSELPAPLRASPGAMGRYLGAAPMLATDSDHATYRSYLEALFSSIAKAFDPGPDFGPLYALAASSLRQLRAARTIFADGNLRDLVRSQSRLIERHLSDTGAQLAQPRLTREGLTRLRLGVLVRDVTETPEGWALKGMYGGLDTDRFEPVLIRMAEDGAPAPSIFAETLCLSGMPLADAVRDIRGLDLDLFVTGAYARDYETVSAIYAHRLAPVQLWHGAVCPTTGGFDTFDGVISCKATEPEGAQAHYTEPLHWIEGPKQCAYAFDIKPSAERDAIRTELTIAPGQVLLFASAMAHKVTDTLIGHWAQILREAPDSVLALAPYAANWSMPFDQAVFEARLATAGLPMERVAVLPPMPSARLHATVAAADLMLDSFPYTGATTVCEALSHGTPVLTCAGQALRQLTGASWVRAYGLDDLVASDPQSYVEIAIRLANDPAALQAVRTRTAQAAARTPPPHDDRAGFGRAYSDTLWQVAIESGRFPGLAPAEAPRFVPSRTPLAAPGIRRTIRPRMLAILASPRTGSTLICAVLNRTPGVLSHFELFHQEMIQFARETVTDPDALAARDADPVGFLEGVREKAGKDGVQLLAFKHFAHLDSKISRQVISERSTTLIHLSRANLLGQFSSEQIAMSSGKWVQHAERAGGQHTVRFDPETFKNFLQYQRRVEMARINIMAAAGRRPLFVEYTRLNTAETRARIGEHIGITIPDSAQPDIRKQNRSDILSRFSNPDEVMEFLAERNLEHWAREI